MTAVPEKEFIVKKIHKKKVDNGETVYRVEWEDGDRTWEPYENLSDCTVFQEYYKRSKKRKRENTGIVVKDIFKKTERESLSKDERFDLIRGQSYKCMLCLNPFGSSDFEVDHIIPLEQGGTNDLANLQGLCTSCHIYKTAVLDRGVIARLLQAKQQQKKTSSIKRKELLEECQMVFANRTRNRQPFHDEDMLNFCVSTVDIFREMCKKKVKDIIGNNNIMDSQLDLKITSIEQEKKINPPAPSKGASSYLNDMVFVINKLIALNVEDNVINMNNFQLHIKIDKTKERVVDSEIYKRLNDFFKQVHMKKPKTMDTNIGNVNIKYVQK